MVDAILRWSLRYRLLVLLAAAAMLAWGAAEARRMPIDVFPDLTAPTVTVIAEAHGMAPEEAERLITIPLESALQGATGVRRVRSSSAVGVSLVWAEFTWGTDIHRARQIVAERLQLARASLPPDIAPPVLAPVSSIMGEVLFVGLTSDVVSARELRTLADWEVRRRLLAVPGVSQVVPIGGAVQQYVVRVRPPDLAAQGVTLREVVEAVRATNENAAAGVMDDGGQEALIYGLGRVGGVEDIAAAVVRPRGDGAIRVLDVADVVVGSALRRGEAAIDGVPAVVLGIQKQPGVNTLALTAELDDALGDLEASLPQGVELRRDLLRQADFIETSIANVARALRDGSLLVVLIVGLFLVSGRATFITALAIPLSLVASVLALVAFGATLNTMTLGGMAIAVGALVDDAIIDVENVVRRLRERDGAASVLEVVLGASQEVRTSIVFATLIIVAVFLPLLALDGLEGRLLRPLGVAYIVSLGASLLVALTVTPVLCSILLPGSRTVRSATEPWLIRRLRRAYERLLVLALPRWAGLLSLSLLLAAAAGGAAAAAGRTFLPDFDEGALTVSVLTPPGTSLALSSQQAGLVEQVLLAQPDVAVTSRRTGRAELDEHAQGVHASEIDVRLASDARPNDQLLAAIRDATGSIAGVQVALGQPVAHRIDHMISGTRAAVVVKVFGPELAVLRRLADGVAAAMESAPGAVDVTREAASSIPLETVRVDRVALAAHGLQVRDVADTLETAFYGQTVSRVFDGPRSFPLVVRYPDDARRGASAIEQTMVATPSGAWVPLEALAVLRRERGPHRVGRENGQRRIAVSCNVAGGSDVGTVVSQIQTRVRESLRVPVGYRLAYGGRLEAARDAARSLRFLGALALLGIFVLLGVALTSVRDALVVLLNLPLALIGGVVGVYVAGGAISVASLIGFIALFGIATRNGIMLVTHIRHLREREGVSDPRQAVLRGASERLAPILMTAFASGLGLLPLALAGGSAGSEIQSPMAMVILFGLVSSTTLNMLLVPAMVLRFGSVRDAAPRRGALSP